MVKSVDAAAPASGAILYLCVGAAAEIARQQSSAASATTAQIRGEVTEPSGLDPAEATRGQSLNVLFPKQRNGGEIFVDGSSGGGGPGGGGPGGGMMGGGGGAGNRRVELQLRLSF